jgi:hypothetical protein
MIACGESHETIARAIGCSDETLRKHFAEQLATGAATKRREVIAMLFASAKAGNVSAQRKLADMTRPRVPGSADPALARIFQRG